MRHAHTGNLSARLEVSKQIRASPQVRRTNYPVCLFVCVRRAANTRQTHVLRPAAAQPRLRGRHRRMEIDMSLVIILVIERRGLNLLELLPNRRALGILNKKESNIIHIHFHSYC